jgi:hypothetical protein
MTAPPTHHHPAVVANATSGPRPSRCVLLVDLDNCPTELPIVANDCLHFARVIACHGVIEPRVSLSTAEKLASPIATGRLQILRMKRAGRNAADFGLAFYAGRLIETEPDTTMFVILSKDADLDHVVELIQALDRPACRVATLEAACSVAVSAAEGSPPDLENASSTGDIAGHPKSVKTPAALKSIPTVQDEEIMELTEDYAAHLAMHPRSRPARRKTLVRSIASELRIKKDRSLPEQIANRLETAGYLRFNAQGQIQYFEEALLGNGSGNDSGAEHEGAEHEGAEHECARVIDFAHRECSGDEHRLHGDAYEAQPGGELCDDDFGFVYESEMDPEPSDLFALPSSFDDGAPI